MIAIVKYAASNPKVIDGDTVHLDVDLGFHIWRIGEPYRLARINAPELGTAAGEQAKLFLIHQLELSPKAIWIESHGKDKYGRWLIDLYAGTTNLNDLLVSSGHAQPYMLWAEPEPKQ